MNDRFMKSENRQATSKRDNYEHPRIPQVPPIDTSISESADMAKAEENTHIGSPFLGRGS